MTAAFVTILLVLYVSVVGGEECVRNGARCPDYTVIEKYEEYEERSYPSLVWVSATRQGKSKKDVSRALIKQLYGYLNGGNDRGETLNMTVPVRTAKVNHGTYNSYTMSLGLLPEQSEAPPVPTNSNVTVAREPPRIYVARSFSGYPRQDSIWDGHAEVLKEAVTDNDGVDTSFYYMAVYDSPWRETNRLNEVWMIKN